MARPQLVPVKCPSCRQQYTARANLVLDVTKEPALKNLLLRGRLNMTACPNCGAQLRMDTPFLYLDTQKELALVYTPQASGMDNIQQQKFIGDLSNSVLNELPAEKRRFYIIQPRMFLSLQSLTEAILEADGITQEQIAAGRARRELFEQFLKAAANEQDLKNLAQMHDKELGREFFTMVSMFVEETAQSGAQAEAQALAALQERLMGYSTWGQKALADMQQRVSQQLKEAREKLLEEVTNVKTEGRLESLVAANRLVLDYEFYQMLTARMEAADAAGNADEAKRLSSLRDKLLDLTSRLDKEAKAQIEKASELLKVIVGRQDTVVAIREHIAEIDQTLLSLLEMQASTAEKQGQLDIADSLVALHALIVEELRAAAPPPVQLLNELLEQEDPATRQKLLQDKRELVNQDFLMLLDDLLNEMEVSGQRNMVKALQEVRQDVVRTMPA